MAFLLLLVEYVSVGIRKLVSQLLPSSSPRLLRKMGLPAIGALSDHHLLLLFPQRHCCALNYDGSSGEAKRKEGRKEVSEYGRSWSGSHWSLGN